jgi:hypothetical protein
LTYKKLNGEYIYCAEVLVVDEGAAEPRESLFGLLKSDLEVIAKRGHSTVIAELFGMVLPNTIMTRHIFRGLKRPLFTDGDKNADRKKLIYTRKPADDCLWLGGAQGGTVHRVPAPPGGVFAVYASPNDRHKDSYPGIDGWINYWTWLDEDAALPEAPVDWPSRYTQKIWTRGTA